MQDGAEVDGHMSRMSQPGALDGLHNSNVVNGGSDNPKSHMRCFNDGDDISKGEEIQKISWVNDIDKQRPPFFHYIPQSAIFEGAYVDFTLSGIEEEKCCSNCSGDCLPSLPCACASTNGGEFVYTVRGLVKEGFLQKCIANNRDPQKRHNYFCEECPWGRSKHCEVIESCKGHERRRFIKECWSKCGCSKKCGNRLVQRGISCNLQVCFVLALGCFFLMLCYNSSDSFLSSEELHLLPRWFSWNSLAVGMFLAVLYTDELLLF